MITFTGVQMHPGCGKSPMARDIAVGMCRITRFAGAVWCPLAAHSILVAEYSFLHKRTDLAWAQGLLHDAHEVVTGEVTRHYKPVEMKALEAELDSEIFAWMNLDPLAYRQARDFVKQMDEKALCAEAVLLGLKNWPDYYRRMEGRDVPDISDTETWIAKLVHQDWRASSMVEEDSEQQRRLRDALEAVQSGKLDEARRMLSVTDFLKIP